MLERFRSIHSQILSAGIITFLFVIPLFPKLPLFNIPKTFVAIRTEDFIIAFFILLSLPVIWQKRNELLKDNLILAILGFWLIGLFSLFSAIFITHSVIPHLGILHYLRRIEYLSPVFLVYAVSPNMAMIKDYVRIFLITSLLVIFYALGQLYLEFPVFSTANEEFSKGFPLSFGPGARVNSTFAGHYDLAAYLAMTLPILLAFLFGVSYKIFAQKLRFFALLLLIGNFWLLILTAARISFAAYLVGVSAVLLLLKKRTLLLAIIILSIISLLSSEELRVRFFNTFTFGIKKIGFVVQPPVFALTTTISNKQATQTATFSSQTEPKPYTDVREDEPKDTRQLGVFRSSRTRFDFEWPAAIRGFLRNPILGSGYSALGLATDNDYLRSLGEVGLLGTFAFGLIFLEITKRIFGFLKKAHDLTFQKTLVIGFAGMIIALLTNATFIDVFEASKVAILFWTLIGLLAMTIKAPLEKIND